MTLLAAWVLFPVIALFLSFGCGLLLEFATGRLAPGVLVAPAGFAVIVVAASLTTMWPAAAPATAPVVVALAVGGYGLGLRTRRVELPAVLATLGVFAVYAAPIVLSGSATFAGYVTLDDTSTWLALTDNVMAHGRSISGLPPSTYSTVLNDYFSAGYPLGAFLPLGIGHELTHQDSTWLFQPQIAFLGSMLSLGIYSVAGSLLRSRWLRGLVALLGAQATLLYGYAFWSGIKEVTAAALVVLAVALVTALPGRETRWLDALPLAFVAAAVMDTLAVVGLVWFAAFAIVAVVLLCSAHRGRASRVLAGVVVGGAVLALPALTQAKAFLSTADSGDITSSGAAGLGNLPHPLSKLQIFGIWPTGAFQNRPQLTTVTYILLGVLVLAGLAAVVMGLQRREWGVPLLLAVAGGGALVIVVLGDIGHGSPWLDGKALATASPAFVTCGMAGGAVLIERGWWRVVGGMAGVAIAGGVLWSNALAYANVWLAPRGQLVELQTIGRLYAGDGPALMTEYQPYGVRHFLRKLDAEGASERRARVDPLTDGSVLAKGEYADLDVFALSTLLTYPTLVLRVSSTESRPPSVYNSVWSGRYYEVWQRPASPPQTILQHLPLGTSTEPVATPACKDVQTIAGVASANKGTLIASERPAAIIANLATVPHPVKWGITADGMIIPNGSGTLTIPVDVPTTEPYQVSLGGSFRGTVKIAIDGATVGSQTSQISESGQAVPFGSALLKPGAHSVSITYTRDRLSPGQGSQPFAFGPLILGSPATRAQLVAVSPAQAKSLCGKSLDWIEAVNGD